MQQLTLSASKRESGKDGSKSLDEDQVRGVVYGREVESTPIAVDFQELSKLFSQAGNNHVIELEIADGESHSVLFKDVQYNPVSNAIQHFDLYAVKKGEKITAEVPVNLVGESPAVMKGASLSHFIESVEVECIPSKLPDHFELDVTKIEEVGDTLSTADIVVGEGIEILGEQDRAVVRADEIREMVVEDESAEAVVEEEIEEGEDGESGGDDAGTETEGDSSE